MNFTRRAPLVTTPRSIAQIQSMPLKLDALSHPLDSRNFGGLPSCFFFIIFTVLLFHCFLWSQTYISHNGIFTRYHVGQQPAGPPEAAGPCLLQKPSGGRHSVLCGKDTAAAPLEGEPRAHPIPSPLLSGPGWAEAPGNSEGFRNPIWKTLLSPLTSTRSLHPTRGDPCPSARPERTIKDPARGLL